MDPTKVKTALDNLFQEANQSGLALLFSLRHEFPTEWAAFVNGTGNFTATIRRDYFPYFTQRKQITIAGLELYGQDVTKHHAVGVPADMDSDLNGTNRYHELSLSPDANVLKRLPTTATQLERKEQQVFMIVRYSF